MIIDIGQRLIERIREHVRRGYPEECCGALIGRVDPAGERRFVLDILSLGNRRRGQPARTRYLLNADDYLRVEKVATDSGLEILGFYHSHPDHPARPSAFDLEHALPWYVYLIVPVEDGVPGKPDGWLLAHDRSRFDAVEVRILRGKGTLEKKTINRGTKTLWRSES